MELLNKFGSEMDSKLNNGVIFINYTKSSSDPADIMFGQIKFCFVLAALIIGLFVNIILIIAIRKSPRLKYPIFQLQFGLAFADVALLVAYSLPEIGDYLTGGKWMFGGRGCTLLVFLQYLPGHVTSCLIVVCCWERFYAVCRPHSALWITTRKMSGIIAITWLLNAGM